MFILQIILLGEAFNLKKKYVHILPLNVLQRA